MNIERGFSMHRVKRIYHTFISKFNDIKLKYKLAIVYILVVIIPFFGFFSIIDNRVKNLLKDNLRFSASNSYEQTFTFLSYKMHNIQKAINTIASNDTIRTIISKDINEYPIGEQRVDMDKIRQLIKGFEDKHDIIKIRLYVNGDYIYSNEHINIFDINSIIDTHWYNAIMNENNDNCFLPSFYLQESNEENLAYAKIIFNPNDYTVVESIVRADFSRKDMLDTILKANAFKNSITLIYNEKQELVLVSDEKLYKKYNISINSIHNETLSSNEFNKIIQNDKILLTQVRNIGNSNWYLATIIPENEIIKEVNSQYNFLWLSLLFVLIFIYIFINLISFTITRRIDKLISNMEEVRNGNFHVIEEENSKDEIGILTANYNYMIKQLNALMEEKYKSGQLLKASELKALQAQINPHFLYNTLEMINWMVKSGHSDEIITVTTSLSNLYKISLSRGEDLITIRDEFIHVRSYLDIQNMRFDNNITLIFEIDESLLYYKIPKIILQPLVENSIFHGILEKSEPSGTITIKLYALDEFIYFEIIDDGVGIPKEKLAKLPSGEYSSDKGGSNYGIKNIYMRLKLLSDENDLIFSSKVGYGTTVKIKIKKLL